MSTAPTPAPVPATPPLTRPAGRYGEAGPARRRLRLVLVVVVAAAVLAWLLWAALVQAQKGVSTETHGYRVVDGATVLVTFEVTKDPAATARCRVQALSSAAAQVGLAVVEVGPSSRGSTTRTVTVRTQQRAVTGQVESCSIE